VASKLADAQLHATRRIRELSNFNQGNQLEDKPLFKPIEYKPRDLTRPEMLSLSDQWSSDPAKAFDALIEARFGATPQAIANGLNAVQTLWRDKLEQSATAKWTERHANEYWQYDLIPNLAKIAKKLLDSNHPLTENNLEWSYRQLVDSGELLVEEPEETPPPANAPPVPPPPSSRTAPPQFVVSDRSGQRSEPVRQASSVPDVAQLNQMSLDQMRAAITARLKSGG